MPNTEAVRRQYMRMRIKISDEGVLLPEANVERLNLLDLAPGGTFGRLIVWTESAFKQLNRIFGTFKGSSVQKKGYNLPRPMMTNADLSRLINSEEVQSVVRPAQMGPAKYSQKKNPLKNRGVRARLFPGVNVKKKFAIKKQTKGTKQYEAVQKKKAARIAGAKKRKGASKVFYNRMMAAYEAKAPEAKDEEE